MEISDTDAQRLMYAITCGGNVGVNRKNSLTVTSLSYRNLVATIRRNKMNLTTSYSTLSNDRLDSSNITNDDSIEKSIEMSTETISLLSAFMVQENTYITNLSQLVCALIMSMIYV